MRVVLHPKASDELRSAALWYDERQAHLGTELVAEVTAVLDRIAKTPLSFPLWPGATAKHEILRAVLHRFPYVVAFESHSDQLVVLAIAHGKRRPLCWLARASSEG